MMEQSGKVYLVGAGPGDPGLMTLRGRELLGIADVVLHDELANPVFQRWGPQAQWIYVGKNTANHSLQQEEINRLLLRYAREYGVVVRLKGGDPFVFGRGGEEALALAEAGLAFEVVPGVTAGIAAAAYAGIPVTHRGLATSVTFITAHSADPDHQGSLDRIALDGTLCFYMGAARLPKVIQSLLQLGRAPDTPAAIIEWGTYARQRVAEATLETLEAVAAEAGIAAPAMIVVGDVVSLRPSLGWFEQRPLFGLRVVLTHGPNAPSHLEDQLRALGAAVFKLPTIELAPPDHAPGLLEVCGFDWILLTSPNAAEALFDALDQQNLDARALGGTRLCAVGHATAAAIERRHLRIDARPDSYEPGVVRDALADVAELRGTRILIPRAELARRAVTGLLEAAGAEVVETVAYTTRPPVLPDSLVEGLESFAPQLLVFTNSAAVRHFVTMIDAPRLQALRESAAFASIGPVTSHSLQSHGLPVSIEPLRHDTAHLAEAICDWWRAHHPQG